MERRWVLDGQVQVRGFPLATRIAQEPHRYLAPTELAHVHGEQDAVEGGLGIGQEVVQLVPRGLVPRLGLEHHLTLLAGVQPDLVPLAPEPDQLTPGQHQPGGFAVFSPLVHVVAAADANFDHPRRGGFQTAVVHDGDDHARGIHEHRAEDLAKDPGQEDVHRGKRHEVDARRDDGGEVEVVRHAEEAHLQPAEARQLVDERGEMDANRRDELHVAESNRHPHAEDVRREHEVGARRPLQLQLEDDVVGAAAEHLHAADGGRGGTQRELLEAYPVHYVPRDEITQDGLHAVANNLADRRVDVRPERVEHAIEERRSVPIGIASPPGDVLERGLDDVGGQRVRDILTA